MTQSDTCKVCGQRLATHHLVIRWDVAHAAIYGKDGRSVPCSEIAGEESNIQGRIQGLETIVRSLRWHATRSQAAATRPKPRH